MRHLYQACTAAGRSLQPHSHLRHPDREGFGAAPVRPGVCRVNPHSVTLLTGPRGLVAQPGVTRTRIYTVAFPH